MKKTAKKKGTAKVRREAIKDLNPKTAVKGGRLPGDDGGTGVNCLF